MWQVIKTKRNKAVQKIFAIICKNTVATTPKLELHTVSYISESFLLSFMVALSGELPFRQSHDAMMAAKPHRVNKETLIGNICTKT